MRIHTGSVVSKKKLSQIHGSSDPRTGAQGGSSLYRKIPLRQMTFSFRSVRGQPNMAARQSVVCDTFYLYHSLANKAI